MVFCGSGGTATLLPPLGADIWAGAGADESALVAVAAAGAGFFVLVVGCAGFVTLAVWMRFRQELRCDELLSELQ
jgi:hypothetical protein